MNWKRGNDERGPGPEWLAAYADGELDRDPALAPWKKQVEDWLAEHPEAMAELDAQRRLQDLWQRTTPAEPEAATWAALSARLESAPQKLAQARSRLPRGWIAALLAMTAAAGWLIVMLLGPAPRPAVDPVGPQAAVDPFAVATSDEIEVLSVEGSDTGSLVVGNLPVHGPLQLLEPGELNVTSIEPAARDNMRPEVRDGPAAPIIWAQLESER